MALLTLSVLQFVIYPLLAHSSKMALHILSTKIHSILSQIDELFVDKFHNCDEKMEGEL